MYDKSKFIQSLKKENLNNKLYNINNDEIEILKSKLNDSSKANNVQLNLK